MGERRRLIGFILIRVLLVTLFLVSTLILKVKDPDSIEEWAFSRFILLITVAYLFSITSLVISWVMTRVTNTLAYFQIIWDIFFVTALLLVSGGISSPFSFLYLLSVVNASVLLSRREALYTASLCGILYGALIDFQYYGFLAPLGLNQTQAHLYGSGYLFYTIFVNIASFYLMAFLTGYLAEKAVRSEQALAEKASDFEDLARLHGAIVADMSSGLLMLDHDRKVRVFNASAESLTGLPHEGVVDRSLGEVLPEFLPMVNTLRSREEITLMLADGVPRILGCTSTPLTDRDGHEVGIIIIFQDVTELKKMAAELKRADRLAAIGELSARIAHEIRNPLAAISGSVQLIAQGGSVREDDRKLLDIVMRESERLNGLIRDFLAYARPQQPQRVSVPLTRLVEDLRLMMRSDPRFARTEVRLDLPEEFTVMVDADQFMQVLWNIVCNSADAMPEGGTLTIGATRLIATTELADGAPWAEITLADTGSGIPDEELKNIFEPFHTTKPAGSGLGLATVYRIVEGHGGHVRVESTPGAGTRFFIYVPQNNL